MKLNLGSGHAPIQGWVNIDIRRGPGVDVVRDLDREDALDPLPTASADRARALGLFEHLWNWESLLLQIARVLEPRTGFVEIRVPYGGDRWRNCAPYHVRVNFDETTFLPFCSDAEYRGLDFRHRPRRFGSCEFDGSDWFTLWRQWVEHYYPFSWHVAKHILGPLAYRLPLSRPENLCAILRRNGRSWG